MTVWRVMAWIRDLILEARGEYVSQHWIDEQKMVREEYHGVVTSKAK